MPKIIEDLKIVNSPPPNYEEIRNNFPNADFEKGVLFTYGDICYCKRITSDLIIHEKTHTKQQVNPKEWWDRYFKEPEFRLSQEVEAYHNQWLWIDKNIKDRNLKFKELCRIADDLSGKLYNNLISFNKAKELIMKGN